MSSFFQKENRLDQGAALSLLCAVARREFREQVEQLEVRGPQQNRMLRVQVEDVRIVNVSGRKEIVLRVRPRGWPSGQKAPEFLDFALDDFIEQALHSVDMRLRRIMGEVRRGEVLAVQDISTPTCSTCGRTEHGATFCRQCSTPVRLFTLPQDLNDEPHRCVPPSSVQEKVDLRYCGVCGKPWNQSLGAS